MHKKMAVCLLILALLWGAVPAAAQSDTTGGDVLLSVFEYNDYEAAAAYNSNAQEFLVVWSHQGNIYGQRYDPQGVPQGENFAISTAPNGKYRPAVAYSLPTDTYLVVWEDYRNVDDYDIYGQLLDADGSLLDNPTTPENETDPTVNFAIYTGDGNQQYVDLAFDGDEYLVVWQGNYQDDSVDILGRFVDDGGTVEPTAFPLGTAGALPYGAPAVAYNATEGEYLVVFEYGEDADAEIHARRVGPAGLLPGSEYTIADQPDAAAPDVAAAAWGAYVVVWSDGRAGGQGDDIYGQVVLSGADDSFDGGNFVIASALYSQIEPSIAQAPSSGQFLVVWQDGRGAVTTDWDIYGQRLLADANLAGQNFAVSAANGDQYAPALAASQSPDIYFVAWEDYRSGAYDLYGQRVAWTGALLWYEFGISAQPDDQDAPAVAYNMNTGEYMAVWQDASGAIYGQRLSASGLPLEEPQVIEDQNVNVHPTVAAAGGFWAVAWRDEDLDCIEYGILYSQGGVATRIQVANTSHADNPFLASAAPQHTTFLLLWEQEGEIYVATHAAGPIDHGPFLATGTPDAESHPTAAYDTDHQQFLALWERNRQGKSEIYGRIVSREGAMQWASLKIAGDADLFSRHRPVAAYNPDDDEYLVAYERDSGELDIYGSRTDWHGHPQEEFIIWNEAAIANQHRPAVAYSALAGRYFVIWSDDRNAPTTGQDLYARWLERDGSPATDALPAFVFPADQFIPHVAYQADNEQGLIVWTDNRYQSYDVYAYLGTVDATPPTALFTRDPTTGLAGTTFTFDASASSDNLTPAGALAARWDLNSDGNWEAGWSYDKVLTKTVLLPNTYTVTLEVRDLMGLTDTLSLPITVQASGVNSPPTATLTISPTFGLAGSAFTLDARGCSDAETSSNNLQVRWDWQNDGVFDTNWSGLKVRTPVYTEAGLHTARVEVRDEGGLTDAAVRAFLLLPGEAMTLTVSPGATTLPPGGTVQFGATGQDTYGNQMNNPNVTWSLTDPQAGTLSAGGLFTASTQAGTYADVIRAESGSASDTASVTILYPYQVYLPLVLRNH